MWLIGGAKNGISSYELHRAIDVTQKSAWFMLHRIRLAMQTRTFAKIDGEAEVDETYIGGKARNMHKGRRERIGLSQHRHAEKYVDGRVHTNGCENFWSLLKRSIKVWSEERPDAVRIAG